MLAAEGHNDMSLGHLSLRDPGGRGFWLKRGNIGLEEVIGPGDFILLDFDGQVLDGTGLRHLEWPIHAEILRARPDVNVVAHTHPFHATVLSATTEQIRPYTNEGVWFADGALSHFRYRAAEADAAAARLARLTERYLQDPWQVYEARRAAREVLWDLTALFEAVQSI